MSLLENMRISYERAALELTDMHSDALTQFSLWFNDALNANLPEVNAMTLATVSAENKPSARIVLLKGVEAGDFLFYTNYESKKGQDLAANPHAALVFYWQGLERQIRVEGTVSKLSRERSLQYFKSRPHGSQLGASISRQSTVIASRAVLEDALKKLSDAYSEGNVPLPDFWGGYALKPERLEFWQGRPNRLHDRFEYKRLPQGWQIARLSP